MKSSERSVMIERVIELSLKGLSKSEIGKLVNDEFSLSVTDEAARKRVSRILDSHPGMVQEAKVAGIPPGDVRSYWYKSKHYSVRVDVPKSGSLTIDEVADRLLDSISGYAPCYSPIVRQRDDSAKLLIVDPSDVHIGKLSAKDETGEDYNSAIAVERMIDGVESIFRSASAFKIDQVLIIGGNDILHVDGPSNTTTAGTRQDVSELWWQSFDYARIAYTRIIEYLRRLAPVHFVYNPSNHDYANGYLLSQVIQAWFKDAEDVTFDVSMAHRKYFVYHQNLIGTTHGDGAKTDALPILMANEAKEHWASCTHRYIYTHHVHHKTAKDYPGVSIESIRSPSGADSWHHKMGYQHSSKSIEGFIHDKKKGQVFRITHNF
jgi:hypothetical protein